MHIYIYIFNEQIQDQQKKITTHPNFCDLLKADRFKNRVNPKH